MAILPKEKVIKWWLSNDTKKFLEDWKFQQITWTDSFIKTEWKFYETVTFAKNWVAKASLSSKTSPYSEQLKQDVILPPDLNKIKENIIDTENKLKKIDEYLKKIDQIKTKSEQDRSEDEKQVLLYETSLKEKYNDLEKRFSKLVLLKEDAIKQKEFYIKNLKVVEYQKELARNKIEILDKLKLTSIFSQENLDTIINQIQTNEVFEKILFKEIPWFVIDFSNNHKEQTENYLRILISKILKEDNVNNVFSPWTNEYKPTLTIDKIISNLSNNEPKVLDLWELKIESIKQRLASKNNSTDKNI